MHLTLPYSALLTLPLSIILVDLLATQAIAYPLDLTIRRSPPLPLLEAQLSDLVQPTTIATASPTYTAIAETDAIPSPTPSYTTAPTSKFLPGPFNNTLIDEGFLEEMEKRSIPGGYIFSSPYDYQSGGPRTMGMKLGVWGVAIMAGVGIIEVFGFLW